MSKSSFQDRSAVIAAAGFGSTMPRSASFKAFLTGSTKKCGTA